MPLWKLAETQLLSCRHREQAQRSKGAVRRHGDCQIQQLQRSFKEQVPENALTLSYIPRLRLNPGAPFR